MTRDSLHTIARALGLLFFIAATLGFWAAAFTGISALFNL